MNNNVKKATLLNKLRTQVKERIGAKTSTAGCGLQSEDCGGVF